MSNPAQEEADRFFSKREHHTAHPEDRVDADNNSSHGSSDETRTRNTRSLSDADDDDDDDTAYNRSMNTNSAKAYHIPNTQFDANTGPKGVIADAQAFKRAKQSSFRRAFANITNSISSSTPLSLKPQRRNDSDGSGSDIDVENDDDEEFMKQWRANRLAELAAGNGNTGRRVSPSKRTWGRLDDVDANGYLDAIEKVGNEVIVVVCIYDPQSESSAEVEDVLSTLAYKYATTRFVKLHHDIAEMTHIAVPAVLAYQRGDVFATISGCVAEGLEGVLKRQGVLK